MLVNLEDHYIHSKVFLGATLIITLQSRKDIHDRRVLELSEVVGFIDQSINNELNSLRIDDEGGSYPHDLSIRLKRPEIMKFQETFIFIDETHFSFRACARTIRFREWTLEDIWLK